MEWTKVEVLGIMVYLSAPDLLLFQGKFTAFFFNCYPACLMMLPLEQTYAPCIHLCQLVNRLVANDSSMWFTGVDCRLFKQESKNRSVVSSSLCM